MKSAGSTGMVEGHDSCAKYLEGHVADLLLKPAEINEAAQKILIAELEPVVTAADNVMLASPPAGVVKTLKAANL